MSQLPSTYRRFTELNPSVSSAYESLAKRARRQALWMTRCGN